MTRESIEAAIRHAAKGRTHEKEVIKVLNHIEETIDYIIENIDNYVQKLHKPVEIYDGISRKKRTIMIPDFYELIVQHMVVDALQDIIWNHMYRHVYGSLPCRGAHQGKEYIDRWIHSNSKDIKYCLKLDIRHFFPSIPHDVLLNFIGTYIKDDKFMTLLRKIISVTQEGLPLGFYTSQWLTNWFLSPIDKHICVDWNIHYYIRYMDDIVIFASNKKKLHKLKRDLDECFASFGLTIKDNWQVFRFDYIDKEGNRRGRDLDFMGFRFFRDKTIIRKKIMFKIARKAKKMHGEKRVTVHECRQLLSYFGWIKHTDSINFLVSKILPNFSISYCKKVVSNYDRMMNRLEREVYENSLPVIDWDTT